jgi:hypothetical protein
MKFWFNTWNHCEAGQRANDDITQVIGHQLVALGYEAGGSNDRFIGPDEGYNVILESFADPNYPAMPEIIEHHAKGCRFIYIATEKPTPGAFNGATDDPGMVDRIRVFPEAAKYASAILHLVPGDDVTAWYSQFAPSAYVELGYAPTLMRLADTVPDHDFGFFGKRTVRRLAILERLKKFGSLIEIHNFAAQRERDILMRHAKVIVQIREHEETMVVSSSRCNTALCIGRPVVAEPHGFCGDWDRVVLFSISIEQFYIDAKLALGHWRQIHARQLAAFQELFTPERCIGDPLRKVGIL